MTQAYRLNADADLLEGDLTDKYQEHLRKRVLDLKTGEIDSGGEDARFGKHLEKMQMALVEFLDSVYKLVNETKEEKGLLQQWFSRGKAKADYRKHQDGVVFSLQTRGQAISQRLCELEDLYQKEQSSLFEILKQDGLDGRFEREESEGWSYSEEEEVLDPKLMQLLEAENKELLEEFSAVQERLLSVGQKIGEITELQQNIQRHISQQETQLERIYLDAAIIKETTSKGNSFLQHGARKISFFAKAIIFIMLCLGLFLLLANFLRK